ncbi:hypothetical protein E2C01_007071 [Portunus trituberculatus]|uniref:Uncharacterized protein n=1 Tax=Portunus trituberculatus TaxID=210409 RepID=A0A5B7CWV3_PORTR|nr:hypothetical protein [Portunus trituberculatus]
MGLRTMESDTPGCSGQMGTKRKVVKEQQGESRGCKIPPLQRDDGGVAHTAKDKPYLLARHFAFKMCVPDPDKPLPTLPQTIKNKLQQITSEAELLHVTRSSVPLSLDFSGKTLAPQDEVEVLGITYDCRLTFKSHIERLAREASGKLASLRRMSWLLDNRSLEILYKAQIRSSMEYGYLAWGGAARKHLVLIDKRDSLRKEELGTSHDCNLCKQRRDMEGLTVMFKVQVKRVSHLEPLRQPQRRPLWLRGLSLRHLGELLQPRCRTWHQQRHYVNKCSSLWNALLTSVANLEGATLQDFTLSVNNWLLRQG